MLAPHGRDDAASVNYGPLPKDAEQVLRTSCPIVGSFGAKDPTLRGTAARLERILTDAGVPHDVKEYRDAGHSFMEEIAWREIPLPLAVAGTLSRSRFHEPSMFDARARIEAFFATHLAEPVESPEDAPAGTWRGYAPTLTSAAPDASRASSANCVR